MPRKTKTGYLSGPMTGLPMNNFPQFDQFKAAIERQTEYRVVSPADLDRKMGFDGSEIVTNGDLRKVLTEDISELMQLDAIFLMPGWQRSKGARVEALVAVCLGLELLQVNLLNGRDDQLRLYYLTEEEVEQGIAGGLLEHVGQ